jgi:4-hydroxy-3-methylbut-2-enyl diphosphate reductase IspH
VGLTAGTSTPDAVIDAVESWLRDFAEFQDRLDHNLHRECYVGTP